MIRFNVSFLGCPIPDLIIEYFNSDIQLEKAFLHLVIPNYLFKVNQTTLQTPSSFEL